VLLGAQRTLATHVGAALRVRTPIRTAYAVIDVLDDIPSRLPGYTATTR